MRQTVLSNLVIAGFFLFSAPTFAASPEIDKLYQRHCTACHGEKGDGNGPAAYLLWPKPRDFTRGVYKFRSTPSGSPPTDEDLLRTLKRGVAGTSMPAWDRLSDQELAAVVQYVKSFSDIFMDEDAKEPPITIGSAPGASETSAKAGENVYKQMECDKCHGPRGKGDGPSAAKLTDDLERPIRPYDFTRGPGLMKGGVAPQDIYRTFTTGLDGTPMPSFIDDLTEAQRWQLVHYIQALASEGEGQTSVGPVTTPTLRAVKTSIGPSLDIDDPVWKQAPVTIVPLRPLWARGEWVDAVRVQVAVGQKTAAFRFEWQDVSMDDEVIRLRDFRDAIAIQYVPRGEPGDYVGIPFVGMGDQKDVVTIWHWKADWEADMARGFHGVVQKYGVTMDPMSKPQADLISDKVYLAGLAAGNPLSAHQHSSPVQVLAAKGFGTLTSLPPADQTVEGHGEWHDGVWTVVMRQALGSGFALGDKKILPVAIAAWDGGAADRNGQKSVSQWMKLEIE